MAKENKCSIKPNLILKALQFIILEALNLKLTNQLIVMAPL